MCVVLTACSLNIVLIEQQLAIDDSLIKGCVKFNSQEDDRTISENGCLCCTVWGDLVGRFTLVDRRRFDHVVFEQATGGHVCLHSLMHKASQNR